MNIKPLPQRPSPVRDELLSSWIARLAKANHCSTDELCGYLGLVQGKAPEWVNDLTGMNLDRMCSVIQRTGDELFAMTLPEMAHLPIPCVANNNFQRCLGCTEQIPGLVLRHWCFAWSLKCERCGQTLAPICSTESVPSKLRTRADRGADVLKSAASKGDPRILRRIYSAMHLMHALDMGPFAPLTSGCERKRLEALAAIGLCTSRPLVKAAIILRGNILAVYRLRRVFPKRRRVIEKICSLSRALDESFPGSQQGDLRPEREWRGKVAVKASASALAAARQAISELGSSADRQVLLARADAIWGGSA